MRRLIYLLIWLLLPAWLSAQTNITSLEYWFDGDYGTASRQTVSGPTVNYTDLLDVSSLEPGLHTFTVRFQDTRGIWGSVLTQFFTYYPESSPGIHLITDAEYWFDGNYTSAIETQLTPGTSADLNTLLDLSSLINGLHTVTLRFKDDRGIWSTPLIRFFKKEGTLGLKQMVALEYWYNNDYSSKHDSSFVATSLLDLTGMLDISTLRNGFNFVSLRVKDETGKWGPVASWYFTKENPEALPQLHQITALEYWYDGDYSTVQNDPVSASSLLSVNTNLDVSALSDGLHMVSCRFRDEAGNWSPAYASLFAKYPGESVAEMHDITALEYWFDGDISTLQTNQVTPTSQLDLTTLLDVSALSNGLHLASFRFKDENGNWSPAFSHLFSKYPTETAANLHQLVAVEYWIDGDVASVVKSTVPASSEYILDTQLDLSAISNGLHSISYRFQDEAGVWSSAYTHLFSKYENDLVTVDNKISGYRYWADDNIAEAIEVTLPTPLKSVDLDELLDVSNFPGGEHLASFQFVDTQGQWSGSVGQTYSKTVIPDVVISASDSSVCAGSPIVFTADYFDADVIEWKFGDGSTSSEFNPVHSYAEAGNYQVTATVTHTDSMKSAYDTVVGGITIYPTFHTRLGGTDTIFYDSFESETTATAPSNWIMKYSGTGTANQIVLENPVKNGIKAFQMEGSSGWASEFYRRFTNLPEKVTIEGWVNCEKILSGLAGSIGLGNFDVGSWGTRTSRLEFNAGKFVATYTGGSSYTIIDYTPGVWYHIRMVHDLANLTYRVYINNVLVSGDDGNGSTDVFPMHPTIATQDAMLCAGNSGVTKVFFDDIAIEQEGTLEVCESDLPLVLGSQNISTAGYYSETFSSAYGCDSIVSVNLLINPSGSSIQYDTICESNLPYSFGTQTLTAGGTFVENIPTGAGCDSTITLNLMVKDSSLTQNAMTICESDLPLSFGTQTLSTAGTYSEVFTAKNGCDSTVVLSLSVMDTSLVQVEMTVCENDLPYTFGTQTLSVGGVYTNVFNNTAGCDSTVILTLNVLDTSLVTEEIEICESLLPFTFGTQSLSTSGVYSEVFTAVNGCDSAVVLTFNVLDTFMVAEALVVCESELPVQFGSSSLTAGGSYTEVFTAVNGCDSTVTLLLTVNDTSLTEQEVSVCESDLPYVFGTQSINSSGVYTEVFTGTNTCDSTVMLTLNVMDTSLILLTATVCESELPYVFGTQSLTTGGIYSDTLYNKNGCDSTVILTLTVNDTFRVADTISICENDLPFTFGVQTLTSDGIYTELFTSSAGCDSTVVLVFSVNDTFNSTYSDTICENDLPYIFGSQSLSASGTYTETYAAANGCDSVVSLDLLVNKSYRVNLNVEVEQTDLPYKFGSQSITKTGVYTNVLTTLNGCDSTIVLHLVVGDNITPDVSCHPIEVVLADDGGYSFSSSDIEQMTIGTSDNLTEYSDLNIQAIPSAFNCADIGTNQVVILVTDAAGNQTTCKSKVTVVAGNKPPTIDDISDLVVNEDDSVSIMLTGIRAGNACEQWNATVTANFQNTKLINNLELSYSNGESSAILDINLIPQQNGSDTILVMVEDSLGQSTVQKFVLTVNPVNDPPTLTEPLEDLIMEATDTFEVVINKKDSSLIVDIDDSTLVFNAYLIDGGIPSWVVISEDDDKYVLTFTPTAADSGCFSVVVEASDKEGYTIADTFQLCIEPTIVVGIFESKDATFELALYPNPTSGKVKIDFRNNPQGEIELLVTDIRGSQVLRKTYLNGDRIQFDLSEQISGTYLVILKINEKRIVRKIILDKK
ncbi:T9SS type A sorting domain-containing protein [Maribellus sediminis]|uniref:T9SS type A sorting domain-containing protein n=1 Tax=Maribellus sediminis TaxID=2696285 RepID=UPI00197DAFE1|nr:T9SS type A sorting domain-containing protein [Maribellus sediminis]